MRVTTLRSMGKNSAEIRRKERNEQRVKRHALVGRVCKMQCNTENSDQCTLGWGQMFDLVQRVRFAVFGRCLNHV
jgi:hypothetical protein